MPAIGLVKPFLKGRHSKRLPVKAVVFDGFPIFDMRPVFSLLDELYPAEAKELSNLWRVRQFEYMWLRSLSRRYRDFLSVTTDALVYAAKALRLEISATDRTRLIEAWLQLKCWPDVPSSLSALKNLGLRIGFLSNMSDRMLETGIRRCGLEHLFDHALSTDRVQVYKPDPRAYHMAIDAFRLHREEIAFVASAGWDAAGARSFGYQTFWVNRQNQAAEQLGVVDFATEANLSDLVARFAGQQARSPLRRSL
jgi:2-haloacid dehalogenase